MERAGIFIGVDRTGGLAVLQDAARSADRMHAWATGQGIASALLTDAGQGTVEPDQIFEAVEKVVLGPGADQLILYFAGHGYRNAQTELWLLSHAPQRTYAAVDISSSAELARQCGIPHVVIISDTCRVAPSGSQALTLRGADVFPSLPDSLLGQAGPEGAPKVDRLWACALGKPAYEIAEAGHAARYRSAYTDALLAGVLGESPGIIDRSAVISEGFAYVRMAALETFLPAQLQQRLQGVGGGRLLQAPDAVINAGSRWLSRLTPSLVPPPPPVSRRGPATCGYHPGTDLGILTHSGGGTSSGGGAGSGLALPGLTGLACDLIEAALQPGQAPLRSRLQRMDVIPVPGARDLAATLRALLAPSDAADRLGPGAVSGIEVRGLEIREADVPRAQEVRLITPRLLSAGGLEAPGASAWIEFTDGTGTVVPLLPGLVTTLTADSDGVLAGITFEPCQMAVAGQSPSFPSATARRVRAAVAAAATTGCALTGPRPAMWRR